MRMTRTALAIGLALAATLSSAFAAEPGKDPGAAASKEANADLARTREELKAAETQLRESARKVAELSAKVGHEEGRHSHNYAYRYVTEPRRARIGVVLGDDVRGAYITAVTPGAPAERAGLRGGDKLIAINGKSVPGGGDGKLANAVHDKGATKAAMDLIGELKDGDHVKLTIERQGKRQDFDVVAEKREEFDSPMWVGDIDPDVNIDIDVPELKREIKVVVDDAAKLGAEAGRHAAEQARHELEHARESLDQSRHEMMFLSDGSLYKLRMGTINPELGRYFGTDTGVLVLDKDRDSMAALKPGDVIVGVAGKQVATPSQVMRGLRSGTPGASVNVEIMRDKKRQVVAVDVPEHGPMLLPIPPEPPEPPTPPPTPKARLPVPPAPPAAPAAPAPPTPPVPPPHPPGEATTI